MKSIARSLKPYLPTALLTLGLILVQALAELGLPTLMAGLIDRGVVAHQDGALATYGAGMIGAALAGALASLAAAWTSSRLAAGFGRDLRAEVFRKASALSPESYQKFGAASLITRTTNDVVQVQSFVVMSLRMMAMAPLMAVGGLILAFWLDATLALVLAVAVPLLALSITFVATRAVKLFTLVQTKIDRLNQVLRESLTGVRVIRAFDRQTFDQQRFAVANVDLAAVSLQVQKLMALVMPGMMLAMGLASVALVWFGGLRIQAGHLQVGQLMAFLQYATQILFSLMMMSMLFVILPRAAVSARRIAEVLDAPAGPADGTAPQGLASSSEGVKIEFQNVTFRYPGAESPALEGVSFVAEAGQTTAFIGGTGSGKSTILQLVARFYDVTEGRILVDGRDVREWQRNALRSRLGISFQKARLFTGTVASNVRWGQTSASAAEVDQALATAQATEFVAALPQGTEAPVDQGGANLSGGQKQRLSVARALVRRPGALLLDDSVSALDAKTDAALRKALRHGPKTTLLLVAQKVASVLDADQIIVLDDGGVAGIGTHRELVQSCPVYQEIAASQLGEEEVR